MREPRALSMAKSPSAFPPFSWTVRLLFGIIASQLAVYQLDAQEVVCAESTDPSDYRVYKAGADVTWNDYRELPGVPALYPGERLKINVGGTVNINRQIYEVRECNWFGLHCWYEKRVRNNYVKPENVPLLWKLRRRQQSQEPD